MNESKRKLKKAIRGARKAWDILHQAEIALFDAWNACTESERRAVCEDEGLELPYSGGSVWELFRDIGA